MQHFVVGKFKPRGGFLPEDIYIGVRDNIARGCVEATIMNEKRTKILLGRRGIEPWPHWWTFGGRMIAGESPAQACARMVRQDLGLIFAAERFVFIDVMSLVFARRQEPPKENGCHDLALFHLLLLSQREISQVLRLRRSEYREVKWFNPKDITVKAGFHPATVACLKQALC